MFNKERFHNQLALNLGYERLLKNSRYRIKVEYNEQDVPVISILGPNNLSYVILASDNEVDSDKMDLSPEINDIIDAVHQAYSQAAKSIY